MYDRCVKHLQVRFDDEALLDRLNAAAKRERRSLNSQILWMLERQLKQGGKEVASHEADRAN